MGSMSARAERRMRFDSGKGPDYDHRNRFVMPSGDSTVELNHDIRISDLVSFVPSVGMASADLDVPVHEAWGQTEPGMAEPSPFVTLMERSEFSEETSAEAITLFDLADALRVRDGQIRRGKPGDTSWNFFFQIFHQLTLPFTTAKTGSVPE